MATIKTSNTSAAKPGVQYHAVGGGGHGNQLIVETASPSATPAGVAMIKVGSPANFIMLTQQNAADLGPILTSFGSSGVLS